MRSASIGVLTFHRCINYGSYWQARCLTEGLRRRGQEAVLLDHQSNTINWQEWRCALRPVWGHWGEREDRQVYAEKARKFFAAFETLPLSRPFALENPEEADPVELVLVGSDEVWNLRHPWYGGKGLFYGEGLRTGQRASYAASFGNQSAGLDAHWADKLAKFDDISVRDANGHRIITEALGVDPALVLDPVLQFPQIIEYPQADERAPYVALYGHGFPEWFQTRVRAWAEDNNRRIVSIGYRNWWADENWIEAGPDEFAAFIAGADAVVTNFFHGCVFALVNGKPFATTPSDYRFNKVRDLTAALGAERHMVSEQTADEIFNAALSTPPSPTVEARIAALRAQGDAFLAHVLR